MPDLGAERVYRVLGAKGLGSATARISTDRRSLREAKSLEWCEPGTSVSAEWAWEAVTEETKGDYRFFKVAVEMP